jgi:hypothetical protein
MRKTVVSLSIAMFVLASMLNLQARGFKKGHIGTVEASLALRAVSSSLVAPARPDLQQLTY